MTKALLLSFVLALYCSIGFAQKATLVPDNEITQWYSFEEWIYSSLNWSYETTDQNTFTAHSSNYFNSLEEPPKIFLNGVVYNTKRFGTHYSYLPNFDREQIDSVVINTEANTYNGVSTPNGFIDVFIKIKKGRGGSSKISLINQVNDPGVLSSTELKTPNVEFISYDYFGSIDMPQLLNSKLIFDYNDFSRTNVLVYNREVEEALLKRTYKEGEKFWPQNKYFNVLLLNKVENKRFLVSSVLGYTYSWRFYEWIDAAGIEIPSSDKRFQASATLSSKTNGYFKRWIINGLHTKPDFIKSPNSQEIGLEETKIESNIGFLLNRENQPVSINVGVEWFNWMDSKSTKSINQLNGYVALQTNWKKGNQTSDVIAGSHRLALSHTLKLKNELDIQLGYSMDDLSATSYNFDLWNKGIGFNSIDRSKHTVIMDSEMKQSQFEIQVSKMFLFKKASLFITSSTKHYWKYVTPTANFEFVDWDVPYNSTLSYSDNNNVGFFSFQSRFKNNWSSTIESITSINTFFELYGTDESKLQSDKRPPLQLTQELVFRLSENSTIETLFRYVSSKYYNEYTLVEEAYGWPTVRAKPIYLTYVTSKTYFFDRKASFLISLRNLLNSTENYNTNGQYYNMSIHFSAVINIGT